MSILYLVLQTGRGTFMPSHLIFEKPQPLMLTGSTLECFQPLGLLRAGFIVILKCKYLRANVTIDQRNSKNRGKPQKIDFAQTLQFGRAISPKSCYAVGFLKYRVIIEKCANFDEATEVTILTLNFNPTSADSHRQTMHSIALKTQTIVRMTFPLLFVSV